MSGLSQKLANQIASGDPVAVRRALESLGEITSIVRQGLAAMGVEDRATEGQVPSIGSDGEVEFTDGGGGSSTFLTATATLTDAQIKALPTSEGFEIVPGVDASKGIDVLRVCLWAKVTEDPHAYTNIDAAAYFNVQHVAADGSPATDIGIAANNGTFLGGDFVTDLLGESGFGGNVFCMGPGYDVGNPGMGAQPWVEQRQSDWVGASIRFQLLNGSSGDLTGGDASNTLVVQTLYWLFDLA